MLIDERDGIVVFPARNETPETTRARKRCDTTAVIRTALVSRFAARTGKRRRHRRVGTFLFFLVFGR